MESLNAGNAANFVLDDSGCVQDASEGDNGSRNYPQLLDLSDDVLLYILEYLSPRDLKALGHTCPRFGTLILDQTLWKKVDARTDPVGPKRLKWMLNHCLTPATSELQITGYVNKFSRCLGIQDLNWPTDADQDFIRSTFIGTQEGVDVEHFLLRMWYPHLPRYAVSPRWPDKKETETTNAKFEEERRLAEEAKLTNESNVTSGAWCPCGKLEKPTKFDSAPEAGASVQSSSSAVPTAPRSDILEQIPCSSGPFSSASNLNAGSSGQSSSGGPNLEQPSTSDQNVDKAGESKEDKEDYASLFGDDEYRDECKGPHFSLTRQLMMDLKNKCSQLTFLALEYCNLDYKTTNLRHFPRTLKKLSLCGSRCYNIPLNTSYLGKVQEQLPVLEYLDVSECDWFEPATLMPLSKMPTLTELYMRDCKRLTECVAYTSLATRYGFRQLRVFDVRGCPLADSEVSALGWLPRLEELYVSPPQEFREITEHTHAWSCTKNVHVELDPWEQEEPEYYRVKSPEPELEPEDKEEDDGSERHGDIMFSNPWWSHERRIIVIQPNSNRQLVEHYPLMNRQRQQMNEPQGNQQGQPRPFAIGGADALIPGEINPFRCMIDQIPPPPCPIHSNPVHVTAREGSQQNAKDGPPTQMQQPIRAGNSNAEAGSSNVQPGPSNARTGPTCKPGPSNAHAGPSCPPGPSNQPGPSYPHPCPLHPQPGPSNTPGPAGESASKRRADIDPAEVAKRRRLADEEEDESMPNAQPPQQAEEANNPIPHFPLQYNIAERCPRLRVEMERMNHPEHDADINPRCVRFRRHDLRPIMHIDVDIHRQSNTSIGAHLGYNLVSDSALLRFGRAENENVNYVHIGRNGVHHGADTANRPDRSNLRVLSVTGYRNITDRSLEHLVTAAPNLVQIDFSETNVTPRGVELFRAVRPECDVIFSEFVGLI